MTGWTINKKEGGDGNIELLNRGTERPENPRYIKGTVTSDTGYFGISNEGFRGMEIKEGETYNFSIMARQADQPAIKLLVELQNRDGAVIEKAELVPDNKDWKRYSVKFIADQSIH